MPSRQTDKCKLVTQLVVWFFFQAEDGIRDLVRSRGLGDVYKRQIEDGAQRRIRVNGQLVDTITIPRTATTWSQNSWALSLIHI